MNKEEVLKFFQDFIRNYDKEKSKLIWAEKSKQFRDFWNNRILNKAEIDQIVRILDRNAKGNTKNDEVVARCLIPQGVWRRMFNEIKNNKELQNILTKIFQSEGEDIIALIDNLYKINEGKKNSLTGKSATAINAMLFAFNPNKCVSVVSLNDRKRIIDFFKLNNSPDFEKDLPGKKIFMSNQAILQGFKEYDTTEISPRTLSWFLYGSIKDYWKTDLEGEETSVNTGQVMSTAEKEVSDESLFYMEKELENFLIKNWDKLELSKEYELIEEDGDLVSQQYKTDIGRIDILVKDKKTGQYVVIELKRNQTNDDTIGQITRYMGWLETHKTNGKPTKGIIITSGYDKNLSYSLKKVKDIKIYTYQIDFKLNDFKE